PFMPLGRYHSPCQPHNAPSFLRKLLISNLLGGRRCFPKPAATLSDQIYPYPKGESLRVPPLRSGPSLSQPPPRPDGRERAQGNRLIVFLPLLPDVWGGGREKRAGPR